MTLPFLCIFLIIQVKGISHSGTEFMIGFPDFRSWTSSTDKIQVSLCTGHPSNVLVTISDSSNSYQTQHTISPSSSAVVTIDRSFRVEDSIRSQEGILIQAVHPITVIGINKGQYSAALFLVLPVEALGLVYYIVAWEDDDASIEFLIIGVEDNTNVQVTLPTSITLSGPFAGRGTSFSETVNRFDTLQIQAGSDLSGTRIESDKRIAIISGNERAIVGTSGYWDHALEMMPSVDTWGKHFVVRSTPMRSQHDYLKFVSAFDTTVVSMNCGSSDTFTLATAGENVIKTLQSGSSCEITSDKPVLLVLFTKNQISGSDTSDPTMVLIPPTEQWGNSFTFSVDDDTMFDNYLIIIIRDSDRSGLLLDSTTVNTNSYSRIQSTDYYSGYQSISTGVFTLSHTANDATYCAFLYGKKSYIAYYVPVGFNQNNLNQAPTTTVEVITTQRTTDLESTVTTAQTTESQSSAITTQRTESTVTTAQTTESESSAITTQITTDPQSSVKTSTLESDMTSTLPLTATDTEEISSSSTNSADSTTFSITQANQQPTTNTYVNDSCWCCLNYTISSQDLEVKLEELKRILTIPKKTTSLYKRGLISVMDTRPAVVMTGSTLGAFILFLLAAFVIFADLQNFIRKRREET